MTEELIRPSGGKQVNPETNFDNCTVKYHRNIHSGIVDSIIITYPTVKDKEERDSWKTIGVPIDEDNRFYKDVLKWVEKGNTIEEAD